MSRGRSSYLSTPDRTLRKSKFHPPEILSWRSLTEDNYQNTLGRGFNPVLKFTWSRRMTNNGRSPYFAVFLALVTLIIAIVLAVRNGFGIDVAVFGVATIVLIIAAIQRFNKNRR